MLDWRGLLLPGAITIVVLTVLAMLFGSHRVEDDVAMRVGAALETGHAWAERRVDGRTVTLTGMAPNAAARDAAGATAASVRGVRRVANNAVLPPIIDPFTFTLRKGADGIALTGHVPDAALAADLVARAEMANPGIAVTDQLALARGAPEAFARIAPFAVSQLANMTGGEARLSGTDYAISGTAADSDAYEAELARLDNELPRGVVLARVDIAPPHADPFSFLAARSSDGTVRLSGHAPSFEARQALLAAAAAIAGETAIDNQLAIADGAPEGFEESAKAAIASLAGLREGAAQMSGVAVSLSGIVADQADRVAVERALREALSGSYEIEFALAVAAASGQGGEPAEENQPSGTPR